jgi:hypothetical protein
VIRRCWAYKAFHAPRPIDVSARSFQRQGCAMSLQSRTHRRMLRHRPAPSPSALPSSGEALLDYLGSTATGEAPPAPHWQGRLRDAAHELMCHGEPLRLGLRVVELARRINWFLRLLELWPADEREDWLRAQMQASQWHAMAGSPLHEALDRRLFDADLPAGQRLRLQALWLAVVAPGAFSLDEARREREQAEAMALLHRWLG